MSQLQLVLLRCPKCQQSMKGESGQVLVFCSVCAKCYEIVDGHLHERSALWYLPKEGQQQPEYVPFWSFRTSVTIADRQATGGSVGSFFRNLFGSDEGTGTADDLFLFVPAWDLPLPALRELCPRLTTRAGQGGLEAGDPGQIPPLARPAIRSLAKAESGIHFIFLTLEADRADTMVSIDYDLTVQDRYLTLLPVRLGDSLEVLL